MHFNCSTHAPFIDRLLYACLKRFSRVATTFVCRYTYAFVRLRDLLLPTNADMTAFLPDTLVQHAAGRGARRARLSIFYRTATLLLRVVGHLCFWWCFLISICMSCLCRCNVAIKRQRVANVQRVKAYNICQFSLEFPYHLPVWSPRRSVGSLYTVTQPKTKVRYMYCAGMSTSMDKKICMRATRPAVRGRFWLSRLWHVLHSQAFVD